MSASVPPRISITVEPGPQSSAADQRVWRDAGIMIQQFLKDRDAPDGAYTVRVGAKKKSPLQPDSLRLLPFRQNSIVLQVRPRGADNGQVYEYLIVGMFGEWSAHDIHHHFMRFEPPAALPEPEPLLPAPIVVKEARIVEPKPPTVLSLVEKIANLQAIADRNTVRESRAADLRREIEAQRQIITVAQQKIEDLEIEELELLEEISKDEECIEARKAISALDKLLSR